MFFTLSWAIRLYIVYFFDVTFEVIVLISFEDEHEHQIIIIIIIIIIMIYIIIRQMTTLYHNI